MDVIVSDNSERTLLEQNPPDLTVLKGVSSNLAFKQLYHVFRQRYVLLQLLVFVMLLTLNILTIIYLKKEPQTYQQDRNDLCLPCDQLRSHAENSYEGVVIEDGGKSCCARNGRNISTLIKQFTNHWYKIKLDAEDPSFHYCEDKTQDSALKTSIKLVGAHLEPREVNMRLVLWKNASFGGSGDQGLQYRNGYIYIPETALYYVYTQLALKDRKTDSYDMLIFSHIVVQQTATSEDEESILNSCNTPDPCDGDVNDQQSSYLGSYIMLKKGDKIAVKVAGKPGIIEESEMNFFGVHKA